MSKPDTAGEDKNQALTYQKNMLTAQQIEEEEPQEEKEKAL